MMRRGNRIGPPVILAVLCLGLGWHLSQQLERTYADPATIGTEPESVTLPKVGSLPETAPPPKTRFAAIVQRPLFNPSRRPQAPSEAATQTPQDLDLALIGVVISERGRVALLRSDDGRTVLRLRPGETYRDWTLTQLDKQHATFRRDGVSRVIELDYDTTSTPSGRRPQPSRDSE